MRENLCEQLAYKWREAENVYIDSRYKNTYTKQYTYRLQKRCKLTEEETLLMEDIANSYGV